MEIKEEANIYEAGYHLVPTLSDEAVIEEAGVIKKLITDAGGEIISEGMPEPKTLAYEISKTVKSEKNNYSKSYFGWVKFSLAPENLEKIKNSLETSDKILRYLLVSTIKESTLMADKEKRPTGNKTEPSEEAEASADDKVNS